MPRTTIDTSQAQSFEATAPGPYSMTVDTVEIKTAKSSGEAMMNVGFKFEDPAIAKQAGMVFRNYMLAGKGAGFTREFLVAFGINIPAGATVDFDTDELIGRHVTAQIGNKEYEGKLQNEVERVVVG